MYVEILIEVLKAIGQFFINPLLYVAIIIAIFLGYTRVKKERRHFNTRIIGGWSELQWFWREALLLAFLISIISVVVGLMVTPTFLLLVMMLSIIGLVTFFFPLLSGSYLAVIAIALIWWMDEAKWSYDLLGFTLEGTNIFDGLVVTVSIFVGLLLIAEGFLIQRTTDLFASPRIEKTKRGLNGIIYKTKRIWLLPIVFVIPGDVIPSYIPYWPQFTLGNDMFSIVIFPFVLGFMQFARRTLPMYLSPRVGRSIWVLGIVVLVVGLGALFMPVIGIGALALAFVGRFVISVKFAMKERNDVYAVAPRSAGVVIAAVLPDSPAEKMGLIVGETIKKVNGKPVHNTIELYESLQMNAAHCKLEVLDHQGELRLTQHVVYSNDHYQIGLLLAEN